MRTQSGFTLLELLIAMTLMSLVLVLLYGGLHTTLRASESGEQRAENWNEIGLVEDFIRRQLHQSLTLFRQDPKQGKVVEFAGEPERITVVAPMLAYLGRGGLYVIALEARETGSSGELRMRWQPYRPLGPQSTAVGDESVLLAEVTEAHWSYFGTGQNETTPRWYDRWQDARQRPMLVRLSLKRRGETLPDLVAVLPN
jgi:general secretion pathway protein J